MNVPLSGSPGRKWLGLALVALALLPSAWLAWSWRAMPQAGIFHDDALYMVSAKSLAEGRGYRIASLPGEPFQTKYPPVYPALLSLIWRVDGGFPGNLPAVMLASWLSLVAFVLLAWRLMIQAGFGAAESAGLAAFVALSPVAVQFSVVAMSELPFCALLLGTLILLERGHARWAGALAALAFLTRGAALPLIVTAPLVFIWRGQYRRAAWFGGVMAPAILGWQAWAASHRAGTPDALTLFYTDYFGFHRQDVPLSGWPELFATNVSPAMKAIGDLLVFDTDNGFLALTLARLLTVAVVSGCIRLMREGRLVNYGAFGLLYLLQFLLWNYPPTARFFLPLLPLAAAGAWREAHSLRLIVGKAWVKGGADRVVAAAVCAFLLFVGLHSVRSSAFGIFTALPAVFSESAVQLAHKREAYGWLKANAGREATVLSYEDPIDYLYTGRRGVSLRLPPGVLKRADRAEINRCFAVLPDLLARHGVDHVMLSEADYHFDYPELTVQPYRALFENNDLFELIYRKNGTSLYHANFRVQEGASRYEGVASGASATRSDLAGR